MTLTPKDLGSLTEQELEQLMHTHLDNIEAIIKAKQEATMTKPTRQQIDEWCASVDSNYAMVQAWELENNQMNNERPTYDVLTAAIKNMSNPLKQDLEDMCKTHDWTFSEWVEATRVQAAKDYDARYAK